MTDDNNDNDDDDDLKRDVDKFKMLIGLRKIDFKALHYPSFGIVLTLFLLGLL